MPDDGWLDRAARRLGEKLRSSWNDEAAMRGLRSPHPLVVRWVIADFPVVVHSWTDPDDGHSSRGTVPIPPSGTVGEIAELFRALQSRQLVIRGEAGSGKTIAAMMLTLGLLENLDSVGPVPFLVLMESWRPNVQSFDDWLAGRLAEDFPLLAAEYGRNAAHELITTGRVMPVLDGLDEMPDALRSDAMKKLNEATRGRPLVLTCRTSEYRDAVTPGGQVLTSAVVVDLESVGIDDAVTFLTATESAATRWRPVLAGLQADPDAPVAQALTSPLVVGLAHTMYSAPEAMPSDLLDVDNFPDREAVERHLLDGLIPAVYGKSTRSSEGGQKRTCDPTPDQARLWLIFLACHLDRFRISELAWWQLIDALSPRQAGALAGILGAVTVGLTIAVSLAIASTPLNGFVFGLTFGMSVGLAAGISATRAINSLSGRPHRMPRRLRLRMPGRAASLGLAVGSVGALVFSSRLYDSGVIYAVSVGLLVLFLAILLFVFAFGAESVEPENWRSPAAALRSDRRETIVIGLIISLIIGIPFWLWISQALGIGGGLAAGIAYVGSGPYGRFCQARIWLAYRLLLPLRLMTFLADAHDRQVLRRVGPAYQFRHRRLQERLAAQAGANPD